MPAACVPSVSADSATERPHRRRHDARRARAQTVAAPPQERGKSGFFRFLRGARWLRTRSQNASPDGVLPAPEPTDAEAALKNS